jgi:hypothetical protein
MKHTDIIGHVSNGSDLVRGNAEKFREKRLPRPCWRSHRWIGLRSHGDGIYAKSFLQLGFASFHLRIVVACADNLCRPVERIAEFSNDRRCDGDGALFKFNERRGVIGDQPLRTNEDPGVESVIADDFERAASLSGLIKNCAISAWLAGLTNIPPLKPASGVSSASGATKDIRPAGGLALVSANFIPVDLSV